MALVDDMTDAEIDSLLEQYDQTEPGLQRRIVAEFVARLAGYEAAVSKMRSDFHNFQNSPYRGEWDQWAYRFGDVFRFLAALPDDKNFPMWTRPGDVGLKPWIEATPNVE